MSQFNSQSCDAHDWCAALNIDSLSEDPINGTALNPTCQGLILGGVEYVNFAFLTKSGTPVGPPNPLNFNPATSGNPAQPDVLMMQPGDRITVTMHDTSQGLQTVLFDQNTGQVGSMTASAANGFGQIQSAPTGTSCTEIPYNFHPMYSTSSPATRVPWAAHSYNIAYDVETGHFDPCSNVNAATLTCAGLEGVAGDQEPADGDEFPCFPAADSLLVQVERLQRHQRAGLGRQPVPEGLAGREHVLAPEPDPVHQPADRTALQRQLHQGGVRVRHAAQRGSVVRRVQ